MTKNMFDTKFTETCTRRFTERDLAFKKAIQGVFEEMSARGILMSGITARRVHEVFQEELKGSGDETLRVLKEVHAVYGRKSKVDAVKLRSHELLHQRLQEVESFKVSELSKLLNNLMNQSMLDAVDSQDQIARVEAEFDLQVDHYFYEMEQAKGKNLKERIINSFYDRPVIAVIAIIFAAIAGIAAFVAAVLKLWIWKG